MKYKLGMKAEARTKALERAKAAKAVASLVNDRLLGNPDFIVFLNAVASRGGLLNASMQTSEWMNGYTSALKDLVFGIIKNSTKGVEWFRDYVARKSTETQPEKKE